jgi:hypothetical protein
MGTIDDELGDALELNNLAIDQAGAVGRDD